MSSSPVRAFIKEHFVLIAGITLPLALIVLFSLARMVTDATVDPPQYKAVYAQLGQGTYSAGKFSYLVDEAGKLNVSWTGPQPYPGQPPQAPDAVPVIARTYVIVYDPIANSRSPYLFEVPDSAKPGTVTATSTQMPPLVIKPGDISPDGYAYNRDTYQYRRRGIFNEVFGHGGGYYDDRYAIGKDGKSFLLPLQDRYSQFDFIGWTK